MNAAKNRSDVPPDPLATGIQDFRARLRRGATTAAAVVEDYLARIEALDPVLRAYEYVARDEARRAAQEIDRLLKAGTDLGPLMGVPVAIKDIIAVEGMPTTGGSKLDVADLIGPEGGFVKLLRRAGCVILGTLNTVEFAIGNSGTNYNRGTPRNPWDTVVFRMPGGSSSGSGVAMAAGLCGFAIGSDTGGSIRGPSAFCGVFGLKTTHGTWPMDGIFPMSRSFDTLGPMTRSAADAAIVWSALSGQPPAKPAKLNGLRLGRPKEFAFDGLDADVARAVDAALEDVAKAGAAVVEVDLPEIKEGNDRFMTISRSELVATFGRERFLATRGGMNPDIADRIALGLDIPTHVYIRAMWRHRELCAVARESMRGLDALVTPTKQRVAPVSPGPFTSLASDRKLTELCAGPTRFVNVFGMCAASLPVQRDVAKLPVGLHVVCAGGAETRLMEIALAIENVVGTPPVPDVCGFLQARPA